MNEDQITITPYDTPWEVACMLINADYYCSTVLGTNYQRRFFEIDDLRRIGEHLINFCNTEKEATK